MSYPSASDLLKHVAFEDLRCGDCIIPGLLHKSGIKGLEAFLPKEEEEVPGYSSEHTHYREQTDASVAVLPLEKNWKDVDFSMKAVLPSSETPRQFVSRLLLRYNYVMVCWHS